MRKYQDIRTLSKTALAAAALTWSLVGAPAAQAIPVLQLYVEGAVYDQANESWIGTPDNNGLIHLYTIGSAQGEGQVGTGGNITDVRLSITFDTPANNAEPAIEVKAVDTDSATYGFNSSLAVAQIGTVQARNLNVETKAGFFGKQVDIGPTVECDANNNDCTPLITADTSLKDKALGAHGEYKQGISWGEWDVKDFLFDNLGSDTLVDITDFNGESGDTPGSGISPDATKKGLLYAYTIDTTAFTALGEGISWHFDLYGIQGGDKAVFAPFSHDAGGTEGPPPVVSVPAPTTLLLLGVGLLGLGLARRRQS